MAIVTRLFYKSVQEKLVSWYALFPEVCAAPKAGSSSLAADNWKTVEEAGEGEKESIGSELPVV